jgi:hypothetical protein
MIALVGEGYEVIWAPFTPRYYQSTKEMCSISFFTNWLEPISLLINTFESTVCFFSTLKSLSSPTVYTNVFRQRVVIECVQCFGDDAYEFLCSIVVHMSALRDYERDAV